MKVLVVDDQAVIRAMYDVMIKDWGYQVFVASSYDTAMVVMHKEHCDCVLTDIDLGSGKAGWEVAKMCRRINPGVSVALMSGYDRSKLATKHHYEFFLKPCSLSAIRQWLNQVWVEKGFEERETPPGNGYIC